MFFRSSRVQLCLKICICFTTVFFGWLQPEKAHADDNIDQAVKAYLSAAFLNDDALLRRFSSMKNLGVRFDCSSPLRDGCKRAKELVFLSLASDSHMQLLERDDGLIQINLAPRLEAKRLQTARIPENQKEVVENKDSDCQLYVHSKGSLIEQIDIVISIHAGDQKIATCMQYSFFRGIGLSFSKNVTFDRAWNGAGQPLQQLTAERFNELLRSIEVLRHLHACPDFHPGMTKKEVSLRMQQCSKGLVASEVNQ